MVGHAQSANTRIGRFRRYLLALLTLALLLPATSYGAGSSQNPQSGSVGLEGTISSPPPSKAPSIATPGNGQTINSIPVTVSGLCSTGLLVKVFSNNIFVGSVVCTGGSYTVPVSLFSGRNDLVARQYDALDQSSPDSNVVSVTFNDAQFAEFGTRVSLSSIYAELGANPGSELDWPIILSGGVGPYAISTDWGDGSAPTLQSEAFPGNITIKHTYSSAGVYKVTVKATDKNGTTAFLQLVGVANGKPTQSNSGSTNSTSGGGTVSTTTGNAAGTPIWIFLLVVLIIVSFWLGRRHELFTLRKRLDKSRGELS